MTRLFRRVAACFAIAALAFAQLAVSAYACPASAAGQTVGASASTTSDDCEGIANRNLCEQHCEYGASSVQSSTVVVLAPQIAPLPWRVAPFVALSFGTAARERLQPTRIEPPLLSRFGVLRI
jgi:hypothetical protein